MLLNLHHNWKPTGQSVSSYWCNLGSSQKVVKRVQEATVASVPFCVSLFHSLSLVFFSFSFSLSLSLSFSPSLSSLFTREAAQNLYTVPALRWLRHVAKPRNQLECKRLRAIYVTLAGLQARADYNTLALPFTSDPSAFSRAEFG